MTLKKLMRVTNPTLAAVSVVICSWLSGYDFDHRGPEAVGTYIFAVFMFWVVLAITWIATGE